MYYDKVRDYIAKDGDFIEEGEYHIPKDSKRKGIEFIESAKSNKPFK